MGLKTAQNREDKFAYMTQTPVKKLVCTLAVPTIISMLITSFYNMVDTFFVGKISTSATAAVGLAFPLMTVIQAVGFTFGHGSGNFISRTLGQQKSGVASKTAATGFFSAFFFGIILSAVGMIFLSPLVDLLGATKTSYQYTKDYVGYILLGIPFMMSSLVINNLLRFQGSAFYAMIGIATGAVVNIALDPLFIFVFHMGPGGAALATVISQFLSFWLLLAGCRKGGNIRIAFRNFKPSWMQYKNILAGGLPSFWRQGLASVATVCLNVAAHPYGDAAIAAMSIVSRVTMFAGSALIGFGQGFQPVCGFNYGAGLYKRVREAFFFCLKVAAAALVVISLAGILLAPELVALFRKDSEVIRIGALALRLQCSVFPLFAWVTLCNMMLQTIGKSLKASVLAMARQGLFFIPLILILPQIWGLFGIQMCQPLADVCSFLLGLPLGISVLREMKQGEKELAAGEERSTEHDKIRTADEFYPGD